MNVPLLDLKAQYRAIKPEVMSAIEAVCDEQGFMLGPRVVAFEESDCPVYRLLAMRSVAPPGAMRCCFPSWPWE